MKTNPHFTVDHFSNRIPTWQKHVAPQLREVPNAQWLEVGSFEGQSARWTLENVLTGDKAGLTCIDVFDPNAPGLETWGGGNREYEITLLNNLSGFPGVTVLKGRGRDVMPHLKYAGRQFNGGYLDSDHSEEAVRAELPLLWDLMLPGAIVVVDDYESPYDPGCKIAVNEFLSKPSTQHRVFHSGFSLVLLKL